LLLNFLKPCVYASFLHQVRSQLAEDEASKDNEENEIPLGVMLKQIKSQVVSGKKVKKIKPVPAETDKVENDFAILNTVRQINLDNEGLSINVEPCNGHEHSLSKETLKDPEHATGQKRKTGETTPTPMTKRSRSSSAHGKPRLSTSTLNASRRVSGENSPGAKSVLDADINTDTDSGDMQRITIKDLLVSSLKRKVKGSESYHSDESNEHDGYDMKVQILLCILTCANTRCNLSM
jgi:sister-chromatid-cohesion protein PDS5